MSEHYYVGDAALAAPQIVLGAGERVLWSGHCAVAEYAFDEPASLPRWTLPEETEVVITDQRALYLGPGSADTGELRWPWPQHLRVQPGSRDSGRQATVTQIQLVCGGPNGSFPALVFAGGDLATVRDADRVANLLRQAIARYRVENAGELGIAAPQVRMLSRLVIGPEFNNFQGGEGQTVSLIGAVSVETQAAPAPGYAPVAPVVAWDDSAPTAPLARDGSPIPTAWNGSGRSPAWSSSSPAAPSSPSSSWESPAAPSSWDEPAAETGRSYERTARIPVVPQSESVTQREAWSARPAEESALRGHPDLDARAADLAARVADLVSGGEAPLGGSRRVDPENQTNLSAYLGVQPSGAPRPRGATDDNSDEISDRAESVRRTAARFAGNAARGRGSAPRQDGEVGSSGRGSHRQG
ncbi:translation initiation factor 2 [Actinoplanes sp. Pm04-4]|uniref:Translation initiation factor 2 n=1 Tax=Paractinoplanes pyxinae TaxID=2997416 RepID=A0ABT4B3L2_9ACTN|nr:translation initiation factor 2 [Actinoplanes pyxinae]MCY1140637.1 translation initiation factor 2 [Actinoplanes pyxinae]